MTQPSAAIGREQEPVQPPPDHLNAQVGVLTRREIEARILAPVIEALAATYGREGVLATVRDAIIAIAR